MRIRIASTVIAALLLVGCSHGAGVTGTVAGRFSLPGRPTADLARGGLNFSSGAHGHGHGTTVRVGANGTYVVELSPGDYSAIGALSGSPPETCAATKHVVVTAHKTTRADFVCRPAPVATPQHSR
jgi:hypothetical protein